MSSNLNTNKIAAAILLAGLIGMVAGKATDFLYGSGDAHHDGHEVARGYSIEVPEGGVEAGGAAADSGAPDLATFYAEADSAAGGEFFAKKCAVCHDATQGGPNKVGPNLWGVVGRAVASHAGFSYSKAMQEHAAEAPDWDFEALNQFLWKPKKTVPGTIMAYAGIGKESDRADVIAYLNTLGSNKPLPKPAAAPATGEGESDAAKAAAEASATH